MNYRGRAMIVRELRDEPMTPAELSNGRKYVYLLQAGPFIKIGISSNVDRRATSIRTGFPYRVDIIKRWQTPFAREIEGTAHELLKDYWQSGEWFTVPPRVATVLVNALVDRRPRTRCPKSFDCRSILFCEPCGEHRLIQTLAHFRETYPCGRCGGEAAKFPLNAAAKIYQAINQEAQHADRNGNGITSKEPPRDRA